MANPRSGGALKYRASRQVGQKHQEFSSRPHSRNAARKRRNGISRVDHGMTLHSQRIKPEVMRAQPAISKIDAAICALDLYGALMPIIKLITTRASPTAVIRFPTLNRHAPEQDSMPDSRIATKISRSLFAHARLDGALSRVSLPA